MVLIDIFIRLMVVIFFILEGIVVYSTYLEEKEYRNQHKKRGETGQKEE